MDRCLLFNSLMLLIVIYVEKYLWNFGVNSSVLLFDLCGRFL